MKRGALGCAQSSRCTAVQQGALSCTWIMGFSRHLQSTVLMEEGVLSEACFCTRCALLHHDGGTCGTPHPPRPPPKPAQVILHLLPLTMAARAAGVLKPCSTACSISPGRAGCWPRNRYSRERLWAASEVSTDCERRLSKQLRSQRLCTLGSGCNAWGRVRQGQGQVDRGGKGAAGSHRASGTR